jgi:hypothetical protein
VEIVSYSLRGLTHRIDLPNYLTIVDREAMITTEDAAVRAHDITVCLETSSGPEFEQLSLLGRAVPFQS